MDKLVKWLKDEGIQVLFIDIESDGYCLVNDNLIIVDEKLNEYKQEKAIRHELRHFEHKDLLVLYDKFLWRSKMENDANNYMIDSFIRESDYEYNYSMVIEDFNLGIGYDTRYEFFRK